MEGKEVSQSGKDSKGKKISRNNFLKWAAAIVGGGALAACRVPSKKLQDQVSELKTEQRINPDSYLEFSPMQKLNTLKIETTDEHGRGKEGTALLLNCIQKDSETYALILTSRHLLLKIRDENSIDDENNFNYEATTFAFSRPQFKDTSIPSRKVELQNQSFFRYLFKDEDVALVLCKGKELNDLLMAQMPPEISTELPETGEKISIASFSSGGDEMQIVGTKGAVIGQEEIDSEDIVWVDLGNEGGLSPAGSGAAGFDSQMRLSLVFKGHSKREPNKFAFVPVRGVLERLIRGDGLPPNANTIQSQFGLTPEDFGYNLPQRLD